jgi:hypothetical protein
LDGAAAKNPDGDVDATEHADTLTKVTSALLETLAQNVSEYDDDDPEKAKTENELGFLTEIHAQALNARQNTDPRGSSGG